MVAAKDARIERTSKERSSSDVIGLRVIIGRITLSDRTILQVRLGRHIKSLDGGSTEYSPRFVFFVVGALMKVPCIQYNERFKHDFRG